jgi:predicted metal-dependent hydrolase
MTRSPVASYLSGYSPDIRTQVEQMLDDGRTGAWLIARYPEAHDLNHAKRLYDYAMDIKNEAMRSAPPISKVVFDDKIHVINNALGLHTYVSRVQGGKLKAKNEIRISSLFRTVPEPFLKMILVHELAHLREKEHNKAFYKLCTYMEPDYHQLEFEVRVYLCHKALYGEVW